MKRNIYQHYNINIITYIDIAVSIGLQMIVQNIWKLKIIKYSKIKENYFYILEIKEKGWVMDTQINYMSCTLPKKPDFSKPLISKAYWGSGTRETQHVAV